MKSYVTPVKVTLTVVSVNIILLLCIIPMYTVNSLGNTFSPLRNKTLLARISTENRENVEGISFIINSFIIPMTAFVVVVICTVTLAIKLQKATTWRKTSTAPAQADSYQP